MHKPKSSFALFLAILLGCVSFSQADSPARIFSIPSTSSASGVRRIIEQASPGDTILLQDSRRSAPLVISDLHGTPDSPITIRSDSGEDVILDGSDLLPDAWNEVTPDSPEGKQIQDAQWEMIGGARLYSLHLEEPIHALIYDGRLMSDARWPNARWDDPWRLDRYTVLRRAEVGSTPGQLIDGFPTENALEESLSWIHYDREPLLRSRKTLGETGLDFTDAVVVISYAWTSFATRITEHEVGSESFRFDTEFNGADSLQSEAVRFVIDRIEWDNPAKFQRSNHGGIHFFFEGLPALDIPEEWWYDESSQTLYFISPDGGPPDSSKVRGKRRDYLFTIEDSSYVHVKGFDFYASAALMQDCENCRLEDCTFFASAYNKFSVGDFDIPVTTKIENDNREDRSYGNSLINCRFSYLDGNAFEGRSTGLAVDNLLIYRTQQTTLGNDSRSMSIDRPSIIRRCTISDVGASVGIKAGGIDSAYELNNISRFGGLQYDGAALQMGGRHHVLYRYNWSHDHPKRSYRFDAASYPDYSNAYGEISYNMAWNTPGGFAVKGDDHLIQNNVILGDGKMELFNMARWASRNERTLSANNAAPEFVAGKNDWPGGSPREPSDVLAKMRNNYIGDVSVELRDPINLDFRPQPGSRLIDAGYVVQPEDVTWKKTVVTGIERVIGDAPDIGAYEYGDTTYWIPGFQYAEASIPIPPDGTRTAKSDCSLMWLCGYESDRHHVYFGTSEGEVVSATMDSPMFQGEFEGESNIFEPGPLEFGRNYYWRVDAVTAIAIVPGPVWEFGVVATSTQ
jgi:hypothetical protein